jgi:molybdopterin molybdotransferase
MTCLRSEFTFTPCRIVKMNSAAQSAGILDFEDAYGIVQAHCRRILQRPKQSEDALLLQSLGRVLAEPVLADRDFPPFSRATRDGYAVRAADLNAADLAPDGPALLRIVGQIKAGSYYDRALAAGEAVEIMTGAPVPAGADAVVMVEYTALHHQGAQAAVEIQRPVSSGENIVPAGAEAKAGQELLAPGSRMAAAQIALAAAAGRASLKVFRKPRIAILSTGDELVDVGEKPGPNQIRNSNSYSLAAAVTACGAEPVQLPIAPDEEGQLTQLVQQGLKADLLLLSGGVSMGKFDLVEVVLHKLGAEFFFTGALIQPGKPVVFGSMKDTLFFGLPGNPASVMVTFDLFARPVIEAMSGAEPARLRSARARLKRELNTKTGLTRFLPAIIEGGLYDSGVAPVPWQGSGDLLATSRANCYLVVPPDRDKLAAGEMVTVVVL